MEDKARVAQTLWESINDQRWDDAAACMHPDYVQELPQSGERIEGRDNVIALNKNFPGGLPQCQVRRALEAGDLVILESTLRYSDGSVYNVASIVEFLEDKIAKETTYFAEPFEAPQWRAQWVRRI